MSQEKPTGVTPTANAPSSRSDLEALLKNDIKVKVAGKQSHDEGEETLLNLVQELMASHLIHEMSVLCSP